MIVLALTNQFKSHKFVPHPPLTTMTIATQLSSRLSTQKHRWAQREGGKGGSFWRSDLVPKGWSLPFSPLNSCPMRGGRKKGGGMHKRGHAGKRECSAFNNVCWYLSEYKWLSAWHLDDSCFLPWKSDSFFSFFLIFLKQLTYPEWEQWPLFLH